MTLEQFIKPFLAAQLRPTARGGNMRRVGSVRAMAIPRFLLARYEDLLADPVGETAKIAQFLGIKADEERLKTAVARSSADTMRKLEQQQADKWTGTKNTVKEIPFVRAAKSGGWKESLPRHSVEEIEVAWFPLMNFLGYECRRDNWTAKPCRYGRRPASHRRTRRCYPINSREKLSSGERISERDQ